MIVVIGEIETANDNCSAMLEEAMAHVQRSRLEPGCISHDVGVDPHNPRRLVFTERWQDAASLKTHFVCAGSLRFAEAVRRFSTKKPVIEVLEVLQGTAIE